MTEVLRKAGRYELREVIGRGAAAVVYLAYQPDLNRRVAVKQLASQIAGDPSFAGRFVEESRLAASLNHSNIVTVYEYFEHDSQPYMAMEFLPNGSLRHYMDDLSLQQVFGVIQNVLAGLAHGERFGLVHRDLKPENLLVTADGAVKIADFGVARAYSNAHSRAFVTATGAPVGTPGYMAPEQAKGETVTAASDLYSLGIIVWEALSRVPAYAGDSVPTTLYRQVHEPLAPITDLRPDVDPRVGAWLARLLEKDPEKRFASAQDAWDEIEGVAIELFGPRWMRHVRLPVANEGAGSPEDIPSPQPQQRSDAPGAGSDGHDGEVQRSGVPETEIGTPRRRAGGGYDYELPQRPVAPQRSRAVSPRTVGLGIGALVLVAVVVVLVATLGGSSKPAKQTQAKATHHSAPPALKTVKVTISAPKDWHANQRFAVTGTITPAPTRPGVQVVLSWNSGRGWVPLTTPLAAQRGHWQGGLEFPPKVIGVTYRLRARVQGPGLRPADSPVVAGKVVK